MSTAKFISSDDPKARGGHWNTARCDLIGQSGEPDNSGYVRTIYRREDGTFFQLSRPAKWNPGRYFYGQLNIDKSHALKTLHDWGLLKSLKLFFGDDPDAKGYISRLEGGSARTAAVGGVQVKTSEKAPLDGESPLVRNAIRRKA